MWAGAFPFYFSSFSFLNLGQLLSGFPGYPPSCFPLHSPAEVDHYMSLLWQVTQAHVALNIQNLKSLNNFFWIIVLNKLTTYLKRTVNVLFLIDSELKELQS